MWWLTGFGATWMASLWLLRRIIDQGPGIARHSAPLLAAAGLDSVAWGATVWLLMGHDPMLDPWLAAVLCGVGAVNAPVYITYIRAYWVQVGSLWAMAMAGQLLHPERVNMLDMVFGLTVFFGLISFYMRPIAQRVVDGIRLQHANAQLAE